MTPVNASSHSLPYPIQPDSSKCMLASVPPDGSSHSSPPRGPGSVRSSVDHSCKSFSIRDHSLQRSQSAPLTNENPLPLLLKVLVFTEGVYHHLTYPLPTGSIRKPTNKIEDLEGKVEVMMEV